MCAIQWQEDWRAEQLGETRLVRRATRVGASEEELPNSSHCCIQASGYNSKALLKPQAALIQNTQFTTSKIKW